MSYKKIALNIPTAIFLLVTVLFLGMNLMLILQSFKETGKPGSSIFSAMAFVLVIISVMGNNIKKVESNPKSDEPDKNE